MHEDEKGEYLGTGVIKRVRILRGSPTLNVTLQIDVLNPLDRKDYQNVPDRNTFYRNTLDFRVRYDF